MGYQLLFVWKNMDNQPYVFSCLSHLAIPTYIIGGALHNSSQELPPVIKEPVAIITH